MRHEASNEADRGSDVASERLWLGVRVDWERSEAWKPLPHEESKVAEAIKAVDSCVVQSRLSLERRNREYAL